MKRILNFLVWVLAGYWLALRLLEWYIVETREPIGVRCNGNGDGRGELIFYSESEHGRWEIWSMN